MCQEATLRFSQLCIYMCMRVCMDMQLHGFITKHHLINKLCTFAAAAAKSLQSCLTLHDPAAYQAPPPMGFSRQEYWSGVPLPSL